MTISKQIIIHCSYEIRKDKQRKATQPTMREVVEKIFKERIANVLNNQQLTYQINVWHKQHTL